MIVIQDLYKTFKATPILKGLKLDIQPGERVALVGQNGCGKTTLIRCLLGLYQFKGKIEIFGTNIQKDREATLQKIAFVPQAPPALKNTVQEIIALTAYYCELTPEKIQDMSLELGLEITDHVNTPFKNLSGGMKQKLLIACALARSPKLLIMDEPSANLDPQARSVFF